ncbi:MAG: 30S ribosomal protein S17 [Acidobacteriia bacterium]|nr:30S ribosomal protein S17 [Terriglobia bacterium]
MSSENLETTSPANAEPAKAATTQVRRRNKQTGVVTSARMKKTVAVDVDRSFSHPLYRRIVRRTSRFLAHDEKNEARVGDRVEIEETRPLSKRKRWRLKRIITRAVE